MLCDQQLALIEAEPDFGARQVRRADTLDLKTLAQVDQCRPACAAFVMCTDWQIGMAGLQRHLRAQVGVWPGGPVIAHSPHLHVEAVQARQQASSSEPSCSRRATGRPAWPWLKGWRSRAGDTASTCLTVQRGYGRQPTVTRRGPAPAMPLLSHLDSLQAQA